MHSVFTTFQVAVSLLKDFCYGARDGDCSSHRNLRILTAQIFFTHATQPIIFRYLTDISQRPNLGFDFDIIYKFSSCLTEPNKKEKKSKLKWFETFFRFPFQLNFMKGFLVCRKGLLLLVDSRCYNNLSNYQLLYSH